MKKAVSFFSNAGIGDIGVELAGVNVVFANELLPNRAKTYLSNHPHSDVLVGDICEIDENKILSIKENLDGSPFLFIATPPCQGMSIAGKRNKFDIRNQLIKPTIKLIKEFQPEWIWLENVATFQNAMIPNNPEIVDDDETKERIKIVDFIKQELEPFGYKMAYKKIDAKDYGIPQSRVRVFTILTRTGAEITFPETTHGEGKIPYVTLRDAIYHLPRLKVGEKTDDPYHYCPKHNDKHIRWMTATPEGQTAFDNENFEDRPHTVDKETGEVREIKAFRTTYRRMWWDKPATTVTMGSGGINGQCNVHPEDPRTLSIREIMILQTIPDTYSFPKGISDNQIREMIGEAVPCRLAYIITKHIMKLDSEHKNKSYNED